MNYEKLIKRTKNSPSVLFFLTLLSVFLFWGCADKVQIEEETLDTVFRTGFLKGNTAGEGRYFKANGTLYILDTDYDEITITPMKDSLWLEEFWEMRREEEMVDYLVVDGLRGFDDINLTEDTYVRLVTDSLISLGYSITDVSSVTLMSDTIRVLFTTEVEPLFFIGNKNTNFVYVNENTIWFRYRYAPFTLLLSDTLATITKTGRIALNKPDENKSRYEILHFLEDSFHGLDFSCNPHFIKHFLGDVETGEVALIVDVVDKGFVIKYNFESFDGRTTYFEYVAPHGGTERVIYGTKKELIIRDRN